MNHVVAVMTNITQKGKSLTNNLRKTWKEYSTMPYKIVSKRINQDILLMSSSLKKNSSN